MFIRVQIVAFKTRGCFLSGDSSQIDSNFTRTHICVPDVWKAITSRIVSVEKKGKKRAVKSIGNTQNSRRIVLIQR